MAHSVIDGQNFLNMIINASNRLDEQKAYVDSLNVFPVPDGDTGTNMSMTFRAAVNTIVDSKETSIARISKDFAKGALMGARGNSGVILSQIFRGIAKGFEDKDSATPQDLGNALKEGAVSAYRAVMRPTEGTILTVIREVGDSAVAAESSDIESLMEVINKIAGETLEKTPDMLPQLKAAKVVDSGGMGLVIILKGMHEALAENFAAALKDETASVEGNTDRGAAIAPRDITYGYCTEFIVAGAISNPGFQEYLEQRGDSVVFVTMDDITKIHIHTENPGEIMQEAQKYGELLKIKIENMREQNRGIHKHEESEFVKANITPVGEMDSGEMLKYAFIAVAAGNGMKSIFQDLGCSVVIEGGQTMNPSTEDIINAINKVNAEEIFIFPNNKNIIMSANQSIGLTEKTVHVVPTKTIPQGISCLTAFNHDSTGEENLELMDQAIKAVKSAQVTFAVRDTEIDGQQVAAGDFLGLLENKIKLVERDLFPMAGKLIEMMVDENSSVISVYYGRDTQEDEVEAFVKALEDKYPDHDVISFNGMQPIYYLIMSVE